MIFGSAAAGKRRKMPRVLISVRSKLFGNILCKLHSKKTTVYNFGPAEQGKKILHDKFL